MSFESIRKILPSVVGQRGIAPQLRIRRIFEEMTSLLRSRWGEDRAALVIPVSFREGTLKLESESAAAIQELRVQEIAFMNELNRRLGERLVRKIVLASKGF